jgi:hypothetical protein
MIGADVRPDWSPHMKSDWKRREPKQVVSTTAR